MHLFAVQSYCFFLKYANFFAKKCTEDTFLCNFAILQFWNEDKMVNDCVLGTTCWWGTYSLTASGPLSKEPRALNRSPGLTRKRPETASPLIKVF